ncbi:MAG: GntR family transcriptional regulator [Solirubrobacterales bacterium]
MAGTKEGEGRDGQNVAQVHARLRTAILHGEIPAGTTTSQVVLSRDFEVGRTPLREALRMLQAEGLILSEPNRRVRIAEFSIDDLEQLYVMRIALETTAARITTPDLHPSDIAEMEGLMAQMDHLVDVEPIDFARAHLAFHACFVRGGGDRLLSLITQLYEHAERYRIAFRETLPDRWLDRRAEHRAMIDAAKEGDAEAVAVAIATHYALTAKGVASGLDPAHELRALRIAVAAVSPSAIAVLD